MEATSVPDANLNDCTTQADDPDAIFNEMLEVMSGLQTNPFDFALHERNINLCRKLGSATIEELTQARTLMSEYFPVKEGPSKTLNIVLRPELDPPADIGYPAADFFSAWISDLIASHEHPYDPASVEAVLDLYQQASSYSFCKATAHTLPHWEILIPAQPFNSLPVPTIEAARLTYVIDLYYYARGFPKPINDLSTSLDEAADNPHIPAEPTEITQQSRTAEQLRLEEYINDLKVREVAIDVMDKIGYHLVEVSL